MAAEERPSGVERTLILLDADLPQFTLRDDVLGIEKTSQSLAIEAITEYSRIFFDLFPAAFLSVCVGAITTEKGEPALQRLNWWAPQRQQSLQRVFERFSGCVFKSGKEEKVVQEEGEVVENKTSLEASLRKAMGCLIEGEDTRTTTLRTRVLCFASHRSKGEHSELIKAAAESLRKVSSVVLCELVIVTMKAKISGSTPTRSTLPKSVNPALTALHCESSFENLPSFSVQLAQEHFGLRLLRLTGIPMRDTTKEGSERIISDVTIVHPLAAHSPLSPDAFTSSADKPLQLCWRTDKKLNPFTLPAYCTHRVSPLQPFSAASGCLFRHLQSGKPVILASSDQPSAPFSHLLLLSGGEVWLHCLQKTLIEPLPASALAAYSRRNTEYRVESFASLVASNTLYAPPAKKKNRSVLSSFFRTIPTAPLLAAAAIPPNPKNPAPSLAQLEPATMPYITTKHMERATRYYPLFETDTLLCAHEQVISPAIRSFIDPLRATFQSETTDEAQTAQSIELLAKLHQYALQNEASLFPPLASNNTARQEAYKRLWLELLVVARRSERLMPLSNHGKIVSAMERLWPELSGIASEAKEEEKDVMKDKMKIEPSVGAGIGVDGDLTKRAMQELQMTRDREREREEEERKQQQQQQQSGTALQTQPPQKTSLGKRDRAERTGVGRHKDLDTPQEEMFYPVAAAASVTSPSSVKKEGKEGGASGGMKLALRRKKNHISEQHARTVYGLYWNAVQAKRAPQRDFDGRADES